MRKQKPVKFYKLTNYTENHKKFQYQTGLNTDTKLLGSFRDQYEGMQFVPDFLLYRHLNTPSGLKWFAREVIIPNDATVCVLRDCFKTNMFILAERKEIWFDHDLSFRIVKKNGIALRWVYPKIVTNEMRMKAFNSCSQSTAFTNQKIVDEEEDKPDKRSGSETVMSDEEKVDELQLTEEELHDYWTLKWKSWLGKMQ